MAENLNCSFCGKSSDEAGKMFVEGTEKPEVRICKACATLAVETIESVESAECTINRESLNMAEHRTKILGELALADQRLAELEQIAANATSDEHRRMIAQTVMAIKGNHDTAIRLLKQVDKMEQ